MFMKNEKLCRGWKSELMLLFKNMGLELGELKLAANWLERRHISQRQQLHDA
jgi:uncharacterized protein YdeI (YjbR/CyaY-like superfamily)